MVLEPKEELHIDRTYFKITNPEEEALKQELARQQLEAFKKLLERLQEIKSKNPAQELIKQLIQERLRQEMMKEQAKQNAQDASENGDSQEGDGQNGEPQEGQGDGNEQPGGQGGEPTESTGNGEGMGFTLSDEPGDPNAPSIGINLFGNLDAEHKPEPEDSSNLQGSEEGEGGSDDSKGVSEKTKLSEKDFTKGGSTHGAKELEEQESKKISVSKKTRFK